MFWDSSNGIEEYTTSVIGFINRCTDDVVPTVTVCTYPNQKPWITGNICIELKGYSCRFQGEGDYFRMLMRNPAMPSGDPSSKQSVNTGLRLNPTTPALMLIRCGRA
jgi:hypothetical protein